MSLIDPLPKGYLPQNNEPQQALRLNHRIMAEVLRVTGDQVLLAFQGTQFVAKVENSFDTDALQQNQVSQFLVKDLSQGEVVLQLTQPAAASQGQANAPTEMIPQLLEQIGVQVTEENLTIARGLLNAQQPVNPEFIQEMKITLAQLPVWTEVEVQVAAALKQAGIPVTPDSMQLAKGYGLDIGQSLANIRNQLVNLAHTGGSQPLLARANEIVALIDQLTLVMSDKPEQLAAQLSKVMTQLGQSVEHQVFARFGEEAGASSPQAQVLTALSTFARELDGKTFPKLKAEVNQLLNGVKMMQLINTEQMSTSQNNEWLNMHLPVVFPPQGNAFTEMSTADLRIAVNKDGGERTVDPHNTSMVFQFDLDNDNKLTIDLSIVDRQIGLNVKATSHHLAGDAENEMPELEQGLKSAGYQIKTVRYQVRNLAQYQGVRFPFDNATMVWGIDREF